MKQDRFRKLIGVAAGSLVAVTLAACSATLQNPVTPEESLTSQASGTYQARIASSSDDAEQNEVRTNTTSTALEMVQNGSGAPQVIGLRFTNVTIPQGATVTGATLRFVAETHTSDTTNLTVQGQAVDNAPTFTNTANDISARARTNASTAWTPNPWVEGEDYSLSVKSSVQEITNRKGWQSGNALALIISGSGLRRTVSFDGNPTTAPQLTITFDPPPTVGETCLKSTKPPLSDSRDGVEYKVTGKGENAEINATGKNFFVHTIDDNKPTGRRPMRVTSNGRGLCISGGKYGTLVKDDARWEPDYHFGPAIYTSDSPDLVMDNLTIDISGDAVVLGSGGKGMNGWTVRDSYIRHAGDDAFQNDKFSGTIDDVLVDWAYQGVSCDNKNNSQTGTVTIQDSLFAFKKQKGTYNNFKWDTDPEYRRKNPTRPGPGHLHPFKWQSATGERNNCKLRLRNTVFYMTQDQKVFDAWQDPREFVLECKNVTLVYVGGTTYRGDSSRLTALREKFRVINKEGEGSCFKVQQGTVAQKQAFWKAKRDDWFKRHTGNPQISAYRYQEPSGVN